MDFNDVVQLFLSAPFGEDGWDAALRGLAKLTGSQSGQIIGISSRSGPVFNRISDHQVPELFDQFEHEEWLYGDQNWRVASIAPPFEIRHEYHYDEVRAGRRTEMYDAAVELVDQPFGCQTVLLQQPGMMIGLSILRSREDGRTSEMHRDWFAQVAPYALTAARMQRSLEEEGARLLAGSLEAMSTAAFILDARGQVCALTSEAEGFVRDAQLIGLKDGTLFARNSGENDELAAALAAILPKLGGTAVYRNIWLGTSRPIRERRFCEIFALPARPFGFGFVPHAMITVRAAGDIDACEREAVCRTLGLTAAEAEIAVLLSEGLSRELIALRRGTSASAVAVQLKSLFEKTGVSREAELVALVHRLLR